MHTNNTPHQSIAPYHFLFFFAESGALLTKAKANIKQQKDNNNYFHPQRQKEERKQYRKKQKAKANIKQQKDNNNNYFENLTESVIDMRLGELASWTNKSLKSTSSDEEFLDLSQAFREFSSCSSDILGELQRLASVPSSEDLGRAKIQIRSRSQSSVGCLQRENFSTEIIKSISPEDLQLTIKLCVDGLQSPSITLKRSAATKLRLLAKNRANNRALIGEFVVAV